MGDNVNIVLRLSALGDLVLTTAFLQDLETQAPDSKNYFVTQAHFLGFVKRSFPGQLNYVGVSKQGPVPLFQWFMQGYHLGKDLLQDHQQLEHVTIYDLHGVAKTRLIEWGLRLAWWKQSKEGLIIHVKRSAKNSWLRWKSVFLRKDLIGKNYFYIRHRQLLEGQSQTTPRLVANNVKTFEGPTLLIAPEASKWKKMWPAENWIELLISLIEHPLNFNLVLVGSDESLPSKLCLDLKELAPSRVVNLLGQLQIEDLPSVAASCQLAITSNSAWLHISEAVGVPVFAFAGPIVSGFGFSPWRGDSEELAADLNCRPCTRHGGGQCRPKNNGYHACMRDFTPDMVFNKILVKMT